MNKRTFVIGDIHGCLKELLELVSKFKNEHNMNLEQDQLVLLGDYIDRGPNSAEVIFWVEALLNQYGENQITALMGNHEHMAIDYFQGQNIERWMRNGAKETLESFEANEGAKERFLALTQKLKLYHEDENYLYVHGGIRPGVDLEEQTTRDFVWIREEFYGHENAYHKPVIFGHTPVSSISGGFIPMVINKNIAVDTSCVYGGYLSGLVIEADGSWQIVQSSKSTMAFIE